MIGLLEQYLRHRSRLIVDNVIERGSCDFVVDLASELRCRRSPRSWRPAGRPPTHLRVVERDDRRRRSRFEGGAEGASAASASLYSYVNDLAKQRHRDPQDDIVTKLINAEVEGEKLSELEFDMFMLLLSVAATRHPQHDGLGMWRSCSTRPVRVVAREPRHAAHAGGRGDPAVGVARVPLPPHRHRAQ